MMMKKFLIAGLIWALCAGALVLGLSVEMPRWLQLAGWCAYAPIFLGGSAILVVRRLRGQRTGGQLGFYPRSWQRWLFDEPTRNFRA
jgi:hypothetical protein